MLGSIPRQLFIVFEDWQELTLFQSLPNLTKKGVIVMTKKKKQWPTPRLLLEAYENNKWIPIKIYVQYKTIRSLIDRLPLLAQSFGGIDNVRIRNLHTSEEIAAAKLAVYRRSDERSRRSKRLKRSRRPHEKET